MGRKKKIDVASLNQTHGAVLGNKSVFDLGFGLTAPNRYSTTELAEYSKELASLSLADLQYHAINVAQIKPGFDRARLINSLERRFTEYMFQHKLKK